MVKRLKLLTARQLRLYKRGMNGLVQRAVDIAGGQTQLARLIGVKQGHVWKWLRMKRIPAERAIQIEVATNGAVTARELRPDLAAIFAPPSNGTEDRKTAPPSTEAA